MGTWFGHFPLEGEAANARVQANACAIVPINCADVSEGCPPYLDGVLLERLAHHK